jgi:hypothetical protein
VSGHTDYVTKIDEILKIVGMKTKEPPKRVSTLKLDPTSSSSEKSTPDHKPGACSGEEETSNVIVEEIKETTHLKRLTRTCGITEVAETALDALALEGDEDDLYVNENPVIVESKPKGGAKRDQMNLESDDALVSEIQEKSKNVVSDKMGAPLDDTGQMGMWGEWEVDWDREFYGEDEELLHSGDAAGLVTDGNLKDIPSECKLREDGARDGETCDGATTSVPDVPSADDRRINDPAPS